MDSVVLLVRKVCPTNCIEIDFSDSLATSYRVAVHMYLLSMGAKYFELI